jgi:hypothetical protein
LATYGSPRGADTTAGVDAGAILVRPGVNPRKDWEYHQEFLADRASWLIKENGADPTPLADRLYEAGLVPSPSKGRETLLAALQAPESRAYLRNLGIELPLVRPKDQRQALERI